MQSSLNSVGGGCRGSNSIDMYNAIGNEMDGFADQSPAHRPPNISDDMSVAMASRKFSADHLWLEQQKVDLIQDSDVPSDDDMRSPNIPLPIGAGICQPRYSEFGDMDFGHIIAKSKNTLYRRTHFFLEVTDVGYKLLRMQTRQLLEYVSSSCDPSTLIKNRNVSHGKSMLQMRDIRQVFGGITRYTIEPRGNCIVFNLSRIRCIIFKDKALFLLINGQSTEKTGAGVLHDKNCDCAAIQRLKRLQNGSWKSLPLRATARTQENYRSGGSKCDEVSGISYDNCDMFSEPTEPNWTVDDALELLALDLDPRGRQDLAEIRVLAKSLQSILGNTQNEGIANDIGDPSPRKRANLDKTLNINIGAKIAMEESSMDARSDQNNDMMVQISMVPKERDMIECLLLETCQMVWTSAIPLMECANVLESKTVDQLAGHLQDVQKLKRQVDNVLDEINGVRRALTELLDENEDLQAMCLTLPIDVENEVEFGRRSSQQGLDTSDSCENQVAQAQTKLFDDVLKRTQVDHLNEMELMLECYLQEIEAMASRLARVDETTDDVLHFLQLHLATIRNNFLRLEVVLNILGVVSGLIGAYAGLFGMNLKNDFEETNGVFWNMVLVVGGLMLFVVVWMYRYLNSNSHELPTDFLLRRKPALPVFPELYGDAPKRDFTNRLPSRQSNGNYFKKRKSCSISSSRR